MDLDDVMAEATDSYGDDDTGMSDGDDDDDDDGDNNDEDGHVCQQGDVYLGDTSPFDEHTIIESEDARELLEHLFSFIISLCTQ